MYIESDEHYASWPYKDMNGFCLDIGDTVKLPGNTSELFKIIVFSLDCEYAYVMNEIKNLRLPVRKIVWVK
jgi:hypothetical protein